MNNLIEVKNVCKKFPGFSLDNVSFSVPKGYIIGFIGPNGAGKTTTIKSILNMISIDSGEVIMLGENVASASPTIKDDIGVVMDLPFYVDEWKVKTVESALMPFYTRWNHDSFESLIAKFGIDKNKKVKDLSRGMKVKLMLATALSHDAKLLILDEPTSGLDPVARDELMEILSEFIIDENKSVLFSTHITSDLEKVADYITFIIGGKIEYFGERDALLESYRLVKGGNSEITVEQKKSIIGYREHDFGFEGMVKTEDIKNLPADIAVDRINLEEIIVYMNKGVKPND
jgi:ABC-type multidrug transport system, ATPase component